MGREDGGVVTACVRTAWLVLGSLSVPLEDPSNGYFCEQLDLGYATPREVIDDNPDADGAIDRTKFMGPRTVTADVHAIESAGAYQLDAVGSLFAPFMVPSARPVLHYVLDRPGEAERVLTLRASGFSNPIAGAYERAIQLQFVAADPIIRDPTTKTAIAWAGSSGATGRQYNLTFPRFYPAGSGAVINAPIVTNGDVPARPLLRIYGPITAPVVTFTRNSDAKVYRVPFRTGFVVNVGHFVEVDTARHTAFQDGDPTLSVLSSFDWGNVIWPVIPPAPDGALMSLAGASSGLVTTNVTQVQATWQDGYLS